MHPWNICVVDFRLNSYSGHWFNYDRSIYQAARSRNLNVRILGGRDRLPGIMSELRVEPVFDASFKPAETGSGLVDFLLKPLQSNWVAYRELCSIDRKALNRDWMVFVGDAAPENLTALAFWMKKFRPENAPTFVLFMRRSYFCGGKMGNHAFLVIPGLRILERLASRYKVRLVSDSERLVDEYKKITKLPVAVLPIPHTDFSLDSAPRDMKCVEILSMGSARFNKGFDLLAKAIKLLHDRRALDGLRFTIQCYLLPDPRHEMRVFVEMLKTLKLPNLELIDTEIDAASYQRIISRSGALVLPHRKENYYGQTSGIFTEALAAGKPVIVTSGTWMDDQLNKFGAGVHFRDGDEQDLARAILELRDNYPRLSAFAQERRSAWTAYHNPDNFVRELIRVAGSPVQESVEL